MNSPTVRPLPLIEFLRNSKEVLSELASSRIPIGLTVDAEVQVIVVDPETYRKLAAYSRDVAFYEEVKTLVAQGTDASKIWTELRLKHNL